MHGQQHIKKKKKKWGLKFSQQCNWGLKFTGMWPSVVGWLPRHSFEMSETIHPTMSGHISEEWNSGHLLFLFYRTICLVQCTYPRQLQSSWRRYLRSKGTVYHHWMRNKQSDGMYRYKNCKTNLFCTFDNIFLLLLITLFWNILTLFSLNIGDKFSHP